MTDKYLINSYNTTSVGTANITKCFLSYLYHEYKSSDDLYVILPDTPTYKDEKKRNYANVKLIYLKKFNNFLNLIIRPLFEYIYLPILNLRLKPKAVLIMANYSLVKMKGRKIVFMRHSYLVDDHTGNYSFNVRLLEKLRKILFRLTIKTTDKLIVQSNYMKNKLMETHSISVDKIYVLPNPISNLLSKRGSKQINQPGKAKIFLYVSRFHPHKNHKIIMDIAVKYGDVLREKDISFMVTIDPKVSKAARNYLDAIKMNGLEDIIVNIGEITQDSLGNYYREARALFFPSATESFGNPLIEAMAYGLPVIVPDLEYARSVCEDSALYYRPDDVDQAFSLIRQISRNDDLWQDRVNSSLSQGKKYPGIKEWAKQVLDIMGLERTIS